jgi:tRNA threonylcarbamoyladenosine biosynthesis protein TsaB
MNILALDASTDFASVALWEGDRVVSEHHFASKRSLSADLFPLLERLLEKGASVDRLVVGLGPGSYAGVRITIAAALGLQSVWGCELVGLPSVLALAPSGEAFQVVGDARRGTWYYSKVERGLCTVGPLLVDDSEALRDLLRAGGDIPVYASESLPAEWRTELRLPNAAVLAELAARDEGIVQRQDLEPLYLRDPHITVPSARG